MLLALALMLLLFAPRGSVVGLAMIATGLGILALLGNNDLQAMRRRRRLAGNGSGRGDG